MERSERFRISRSKFERLSIGRGNKESLRRRIEREANGARDSFEAERDRFTRTVGNLENPIVLISDVEVLRGVED